MGGDACKVYDFLSMYPISYCLEFIRFYFLLYVNMFVNKIIDHQITTVAFILNAIFYLIDLFLKKKILLIINQTTLRWWDFERLWLCVNGYLEFCYYLFRKVLNKILKMSWKMFYDLSGIVYY